jgi:glutathionylspermidine synthase
MCAFVTAVVKVHWMTAVEIGIVWDVDRFSVQQNSLVVFGGKPERITVLAQSVQVGVVGQISAQTDILLLKDKLCARRVEDDFVVADARDFERKGLFYYLKAESGFRKRSVFVLWPWEDLFLDLKDVEACVIDFNVESVAY